MQNIFLPSYFVFTSGSKSAFIADNEELKKHSPVINGCNLHYVYTRMEELNKSIVKKYEKLERDRGEEPRSQNTLQEVASRSQEKADYLKLYQLYSLGFAVIHLVDWMTIFSKIHAIILSRYTELHFSRSKPVFNSMSDIVRAYKEVLEPIFSYTSCKNLWVDEISEEELVSRFNFNSAHFLSVLEELIETKLNELSEKYTVASETSIFNLANHIMQIFCNNLFPRPYSGYLLSEELKQFTSLANAARGGSEGPIPTSSTRQLQGNIADSIVEISIHAESMYDIIKKKANFKNKAKHIAVHQQSPLKCKRMKHIIGNLFARHKCKSISVLLVYSIANVDEFYLRSSNRIGILSDHILIVHFTEMLINIAKVHFYYHSLSFQEFSESLFK